MIKSKKILYEYCYEISPCNIGAEWEFVAIYIQPKDKFEYWIFRREI